MGRGRDRDGNSAVESCIGLFSMVITIGGVACFAAGVYVLVDDHHAYVDDVVNVTTDVKVDTAAYVMIGVGIVLFFTSIVGCCGIRSQNTGLLFGYVCLALVVCGGEFAGGILASNFKANIGGILENNLYTSFNNYQPKTNVSSENDIVVAWDYLQDWFDCCGARDYKDYRVVKFQDPQMFVPETCCLLKSGNAQNPVPVNNTACQLDARAEVNSSDFLFTNGCLPDIQHEVEWYASIIIGVAFGMTFLQLLLLILARCAFSGSSGSGRGYFICRWRC